MKSDRPAEAGLAPQLPRFIVSLRRPWQTALIELHNSARSRAFTSR
jgi:hypothetical protein